MEFPLTFRAPYQVKFPSDAIDSHIAVAAIRATQYCLHLPSIQKKKAGCPQSYISLKEEGNRQYELNSLEKPDELRCWNTRQKFHPSGKPLVLLEQIEPHTLAPPLPPGNGEITTAKHDVLKRIVSLWLLDALHWQHLLFPGH